MSHEIALTAVQYVNINGEPIRIGATPGLTKAPPKPRKEGPEEYHRGFLVEGIPVGAMEAAKAAQDQECAKWAALPDDEKAARLRSKEREPEPWDEAKWRARFKLKRVAKPFEVPAAAELCRQMAESIGWLDVTIRELKKTKGAA